MSATLAKPKAKRALKAGPRKPEMDAHERQAVSVARGYVRGEREVARRLTPAPAAPVVFAGSGGVPLSRGLRADLEAGFGAELSAVRIHYDANAAIAAREFGALAFTAGRHIYFAEGAFNPVTKSGRELVAHEVAHVLQQTGRPGPDDRLRATTVSGFGPLQLAPGPGAIYQNRTGTTFQTLKQAHTKENDDPELAKFIAGIETALGGSLDGTTLAATDLEAAVLRNEKDFIKAPAAARSFLYDCLKLLDKFDGAAHLINLDPMLESVVYLREIVAVVSARNGLGWFAKVADAHPVLKKYWPKAFVDTFLQYLIGPTRDIPSLWVADHGKFEVAWKNFLDTWQQELGIGPTDNELMVEAFGTVNQLDTLRRQQMIRFTEDVGRVFGGLSATRVTIRGRRYTAYRVLAWANELVKSQAPAEIFQPLGRQIAAVAQQAIDFWNVVFASIDAVGGQATALQTDTLSDAVMAVVQSRKIFSETVPRKVATAATTLFKLTTTGSTIDIPSEKAYAQQRTTARDALFAFAQKELELPLIDLVRRNQKDDRAVAVVYGSFLLWLHDFVDLLDSYSEDADRAYQAANAGQPDIRVAHRLRVAHAIRRLAGAVLQAKGGGLAAWKDLDAVAEGVVTGSQERRSRLALLSDWEVQGEAPIGQIVRDFPEGITGLGGATPSQIVRLVLALYYEDLDLTIKRLLAQAPKGEDLNDPAVARAALTRKPLLAEAIEDTEGRRRPRRWIIKDFAFAHFPERQEIPGHGEVEPAEVADILVKNHPKTLAFVKDATKVPPGAELLFPITHQATDAVFLWVLPNFADLVADLRSDQAGLNEVIATPTTPVEHVKRFSDDVWLDLLLTSAGASEAIEKFTTTRIAEQKKLMTTSIRAAVSHERQLLATRIKAAFGHYTGRADKTWDVPFDVLNAIESFGKWVVPEEDQFAQIAALVLKIAPQLADKLGDESRFDIITGYYGLIVLALSYSAGDKLKQLDLVLSQEERAAIADARVKLGEVRKKFDAVRSRVQTRFGFKSDDGTVLDSLVYAHPITVDPDGFDIDGDHYELVKVHRKFKYHPPYGTKPLPTSPEGEGGYKPPLLFVDGSEYDVETNAPIALLDIRINGALVTVTSRDVVLLNQLSHVIEVRANQIGLEELGELIEGAVEFALDLAEFIPGAGQAIAAARIVATIVEFIASGEFEEIVAAVSGEPVEAILELVSHVKDMFNPDDLWTLLLFGSPMLDKLRSKKPSDKSQRTRKRARKKGKGTPLTKALAQVSNIRAGFAKSMDALSDRVQAPVRGFQVSVLSRPRLALGLSLVADNLYRLEGIGDPADLDIVKGIATEQVEFKARLETVLAGLEALELPAKVVPTEALVAAIIDFLLGRLGAKGKAARFLLNVTGTMDDVAGLVTDGLNAVGVDPNDEWLKIKASIETSFADARTALVDGIYAVFNDPPLSLGLKPPPPKAISVTMSGEGFAPDVDEEIAPAVEPFGFTAPNANAALALPPPTVGQPLPPPMRASAELRFGHDFGHVRLHEGGDAARATGAIGAEALTTGSHVYLRPGLAPEGGAGGHILDHELTHVLQQTGPRPFGGQHDARPQVGAPGEGLRIDRGREAAAERVAGEVHGRVAGGPIDAGASGKADGVQPAAVSLPVLQKLLAELSSPEKAKEAAAAIDRDLAHGTKTAKVPDAEERIAQAIWSEAAAQVAKIKDSDLPASPYLRETSIRAALLKHFDGQIGFVRKAVPFLAMGALETKPIPAAKGGGKSDSKPKTKQELDVERFASSLRSYVMSLTGVTLVFAVKERPADASTPTGGWIKGDVTITNLLLDNLGGTSPLWEKALSNSGITGEEVEKLRPLIRAALRLAGVKPTVPGADAQGNSDQIPIWASGGFAFHNDFLAYVRRQALAAGSALPTSVPPWSAYANHNDKAGGPIIGVRVGLYGDNAQWGPNRESHHTTQHLLVEYFQNETAGQQPFDAKAKAGWQKLGVQWTSEGPASLQAPGKDAVRFSDLDTGERGNAMPAILLATTTHHDDLHVEGQKPEDWVPSSSTKKPNQSQGGAMHNIFRRLFFTGAAAAMKDKSGADFTTAVSALDPAALTAAQGQLYTAVQGSYHWMRAQMIPALKRSLPSTELGYYEFIEREIGKVTADVQAKEHDARTKTMETIAKKAEENNDAVMTAYGWKS